MTKYRLIAFSLLAVMAFASPLAPATAQMAPDQGPLGLTWSMPVDQVKALGAELKDLPITDYGVSFVATKLPRVLSDQEATIVSFGYNDKLWRIVAVGKAFSNDPAGTNLKLRYQELLAALAEKYGKPSTVHSLGDSIYQEPQYFLAGIHGGRTSWYSNFSTQNLTIQLNLSADDSSTGRWRIIYEEKSLRKAFEVAKKVKEKNAL